MEIVREARQPATHRPPEISSIRGSGRLKEEIKNHPRFSKNVTREEPEAIQAIYHRNDNSTFSPQRLESTMEVVVESRKPATDPASVFSLSGGLGLAKVAHDNDHKENVEHEVEEEDKHDKQVKEVYEDKQVEKVDDEDKQVRKVHEDKQVKEAYKFKMIKMLYKTSLFLTYTFLQFSLYQ